MKKGTKHSEETRARMRASRGTDARNTNSDYYKSGRLHARALAMAREAGFASGRARAIPEAEAAFRQKLSSCRSAACRRGFEFSLTAEEFAALVSQVCWYCGGEPSHTWAKRYPTAPMFNGIDRLVNAQGYVKGNVVPCCGRCNRAKHTMAVDEFLALARRISERHGEDSRT